MMMESVINKGDVLYVGKVKSLYATDDPKSLVVEFRDDTTAFDGGKKAKLARKGMVNNRFNAFIMEHLHQAGIETHFERLLSDRESLVKHLKMIQIECVIRNIAAGSLCRRLGIEEGIQLDPPIFEFFLKNDELHDPMINEYHILSFGWAEEADLVTMKRLTFEINEILKPLFLDANMLLVDYKLEFGKFNDQIVLGDEFTPDGCRIWDKETKESMDKDRFRKDLGDVIATYEQAATRLGINLTD